VAGGIASATNVEATKTPPERSTLLISATYENIINIVRTFTNRHQVGENISWIKNIIDGWITELKCRNVIKDYSI
jgi:hypothetical protein